MTKSTVATEKNESLVEQPLSPTNICWHNLKQDNPVTSRLDNYKLIQVISKLSNVLFTGKSIGLCLLNLLSSVRF